MAESDSEAVLVLADMAGNYYILTRDVLERTRVASEVKARVEEHIVDVVGFSQSGGGYRVIGVIPCDAVPAESRTPRTVMEEARRPGSA